MESALKISPVEQVELLIDLYNNNFDFSIENITAVKNALCISSSDTYALYGKTGTGRVNEKDISGWFMGYVETRDTTYFFATNIPANTNATGSHAAEITFDIFKNLNIIT